MNPNQYQKLAARSASGLTTTDLEGYAVVGMIGELGELVELFKKKIYHNKIPTLERVQEEAGDLLWYISLAATARGTSFVDWLGGLDFEQIEELAIKSVSEAQKADQETIEKLLDSPANFLALARLPVGACAISEAVVVLAALLIPYGGLTAAAIANIEKLEARHNLPSWKEAA